MAEKKVADVSNVEFDKPSEVTFDDIRDETSKASKTSLAFTAEDGVVETRTTPLPQEGQGEKVEWANMTDAAIRHTLVMRTDIPLDEKIGNWTAEEWSFAGDFGMTPQRLEEYSGRKVSDLLSDAKSRLEEKQ